MPDVLITKGLRAKLKERNIMFYPWVKVGHTIGDTGQGFEPASQHPADQIMPMGSYSYSLCSFAPCASIGRFCSIGQNISVFGNRHPLDWVSSSPVFYRRRRFVKLTSQPPATPMPPHISTPLPVVIENDVWIGDNVILRDGITISTGAVIAAGSVVTHDVDPYMIVGGAPAKVIRSRFPDALRDAMLDSEWWLYNVTELQSLPISEPMAFLDSLGDLIHKNALTKRTRKEMTLQELIDA